MEPTDKQALYGKLRRAGKDLKPIIVIFAFAIVMTVVAITVSSMMRQKNDQQFRQPVEQRFRELVYAGDAASQQEQYKTAENLYRQASTVIRESGKKDSFAGIMMQAALELRLANLAEQQGNSKECLLHLLHAHQQKIEFGKVLDSKIREVQQEVQEQ